MAAPLAVVNVVVIADALIIILVIDDALLIVLVIGGLRCRSV